MAHAYTAAEVEHIAKRLGGAGKNGSGWDCRCPAHEDGKASLSLSIGKGSKLLWHCLPGASSPRCSRA
jgi:putative DNA primase/helicase